MLFPDGRLSYCNAGHNAPMLVTSGTRDVQRLEVGRMVIGLFDGVSFDEGTVALRPGDFLVVFSDGVSEALDSDEEKFGDDRLVESLGKMTAVEAKPRLEHVFASVETFTAGAPQHDDVTAMIVEYRGTSG